MIFLENMAVILNFFGVSCLLYGLIAFTCDDVIQPYLWPEEPKLPPTNGDDDDFV